MTIRYEPGYAHVEGHEFWKFLEEVQEVTGKGYVLDISNDRFPTQFVGYWSAYFVEGKLVVLSDVPSLPVAGEAALGVSEENTDTGFEAKAEEDSTTSAPADAPRRGRPPRNR